MTIDELVDFADSIKSKKDFSKFVFYYLEDFLDNKEEWENNDLSGFLSGLSLFVNDIDGYYMNMDETVDLERPTWKIFADILLAARVYEG